MQTTRPPGYPAYNKVMTAMVSEIQSLLSVRNSGSPTWLLQKHTKTVPKSRCHSRIGFFTHSSPNKISGGGNTKLFLDAGGFKDEVFEAGVLFASNCGTGDLMKTPSECSSQKSSLCNPSSFFGIPGYYLRVIMAPEACPQWSFLSLPGYYLRVIMAPEACRQWLWGHVWAAR